MSKRTLHLVAYDITSDRQRARALRVIQAFGIGGQKSVHECLLTLGDRRELEARLRALVDADGDRLLILKLDPRSRIDTLGRAVPPPDPPYFYVG